MPQYRVRLGQVLVVGALALDQIGNRIEAEPVDAELVRAEAEAVNCGTITKRN
jgi:hypothetical protein